MKNLIKIFWPRESRRGPREISPPVVTYYWDGERATPAAHCIQNISVNGFYLLTERRWYLGTLMRVTMQSTEGDVDPKRVITVMAEVIRSGSDGVGFEFIFPKPRDEKNIWGIEARKLADKKTLKKFMRRHHGSSQRVWTVWLII